MPLWQITFDPLKLGSKVIYHRGKTFFSIRNLRAFCMQFLQALKIRIWGYLPSGDKYLQIVRAITVDNFSLFYNTVSVLIYSCNFWVTMRICMTITHQLHGIPMVLLVFQFWFKLAKCQISNWGKLPMPLLLFHIEVSIR